MAFDPSDLLTELESMPPLVEEAARRAADVHDVAPRGGGFSLVEQAWHLADLEREGFAERIDRLRGGGRPQLPDFDGARVAGERDYRHKALAEGVVLFRQTRHRNLEALRSLSPAEWEHEGEQEQVGPVRLRDIPRLMCEHDRGHRQEILELLAELGR
jgi:hypothetical protein